MHLAGRDLRSIKCSCTDVSDSNLHGPSGNSIRRGAHVLSPSLLRDFLLLLLCRAVQVREVADTAVGLLKDYNRRTLDVIAARIYFYYSWAYECLGRLADVRR